MTLEHLGLAVADADAAVALFERLLGAPPYKSETVEREGVRTVFFGDGGQAGRAPKLELLDALTPDSPVAKFLEKRGPGLHHVAFEVGDLEAAMTQLQALGFTLLADAPKPGADGKRIVFLHPRSTAGVLVELCAAAPPERLAVPFEGGTLAAFRHGPPEAPPLVVLHGALDHAGGDTAALARRLARSFCVYALDFMGHGASDPFGGQALTIDALVGNVLALLDAAGLERAAIFGYSLGGAVALHAAHRRPDRFTRLAVHAAHVQWTEAEVAEVVGAMAPSSGIAPGAAPGADRLFDTARRMHTLARLLPRHALSDDTLAVLPHPTLVSCGDHDSPVLFRSALHLRDALPNASLAVLPGAGHAIQAETASLLAALVAGHLEARS